jgi:hypothetical protein
MIILNMQFWAGDKDRAMALSRLIADLEPTPRTDAMFMFTARFDCEHDKETIEYVSQKFPVIIYKTRRNAGGWPNGPNQMMACSYEFLVESVKRNSLKGINLQTDFVLFMESDCVPLRNNWIRMLSEEFMASGKSVVGAWLKAGDANCEHVNGNCLVAMNFYRKFPSIFHPPERGGWDATLAYGILPHAHPSKLIWSDYQLGMNHNPWRGDGYLWEPKRYGCKDNALYGIDLYPAWFHGIKTEQGLTAVRKRLIHERKN